MTNNEAKWIPFFGESDKCSNCLVETNRPLMYYHDSPSPRYEQYHFCPWCGKKMKGDLIFDIETGERKEGEQDD